MMRALVSCLGVVATVAVAAVFASPAEAQILPADSSPVEKCAVVNTALERLTGVPSTTASLPALATPQVGVPASYTDNVARGRGFEISAGIISADTRYGATFVGDVEGELPGVHFTSINYTPPSPGGGVTNLVVGGEWALCGSWGTLTGSFTDGTVQWNADGTLADVATNMSVGGGSVNGVALTGGSGTFSGVLDHTPLAQDLPPIVGGTLELQSTAAPATAATPLPDTGGSGLLLPLVAVGLVSTGILGALLLFRPRE
jgi:hypothetical protein